MTTTADLRRALAAAGCPAPSQWPPQWHETTGSTNATARELADSGAPEWSLVAAGHQTDGRGRLGRTWVDRPGEALLFSVVLRPDIAPAAAGLLSLLAGAAMAEASAALVGAEIRCKWPNDLLIDGAKAGGILAEAQVSGGALAHVVMGVGVNLAAPEGVEGATGIGEADPMALLAGFLRTFRDGYRPGEPGFPADVVARWSRTAATLGREVEVSRAGADPVRGIATRVDELGGLVLDTAQGAVTVTSGEVTHLR